MSLSAGIRPPGTADRALIEHGDTAAQERAAAALAAAQHLGQCVRSPKVIPLLLWIAVHGPSNQRTVAQGLGWAETTVSELVKSVSVGFYRAGKVKPPARVLLWVDAPTPRQGPEQRLSLTAEGAELARCLLGLPPATSTGS